MNRIGVINEQIIENKMENMSIIVAIATIKAPKATMPVGLKAVVVPTFIPLRNTLKYDTELESAQPRAFSPTTQPMPIAAKIQPI